jgi:hypothetical protein
MAVEEMSELKGFNMPLPLGPAMWVDWSHWKAQHLKGLAGIFCSSICYDSTLPDY